MPTRFPTKWKPLRFRKPDYLRMEVLRKRHGPVLRRGPVKTRMPKMGQDPLEARAVPFEAIRGSLEERIVYKELLRRKISFDFQSSMQGGRQELGGIVVDFIIFHLNVAMRVQGTIWHTGAEAVARDEIHRALLENQGYHVWDIWDWQIHDKDLFEDWMRRHLGGAI